MGRARKSLGTALRVAVIRRLLGDELVREVGYIADGADAYRHLGESDMNHTLYLLRKALHSGGWTATYNDDRVFAHPEPVADPLFLADPWHGQTVACSREAPTEQSDAWARWAPSS